jgi:predicted nucleotidyltransferase
VTPEEIAACRASLHAREQRQQAEREARRAAALAAARQAVAQAAPQFPAVRRVYLFGSVVQPGAMRQCSDIDVAVEHRLSAEDYFGFWRALERAAPGRAFDLAELEGDTPFAAGVRHSGVVVYECADADTQGGD